MTYDLSTWHVVDDEDLDAQKQSDMIDAIEDDLNDLGTLVTGKVPSALADAKGDLLVASAADTFGKLPVGTNAHVLTADSSLTYGMGWTAAPSAPTLPTTLTGRIPASGTSASAGTGFTYGHTNGSGVYSFTFSTTFSAVPVALVNTTDHSASVTVAELASVGVKTMVVNTFHGSDAAAADAAFNFLVYSVT